MPEPSERYYLFSLELPRYDKSGELDIVRDSHQALQNADYAFVRQSDEHADYVEFKIVKNRAGIPFDYTPEYAWLKQQYPSMAYYYSLAGGARSGVIRVTCGRDLLLIKMMHGADKCLNRNLR